MQEAFDSEGFCFFKEKKLKHIVLGALPQEEVKATFVGRKHKELFYVLDESIKKNPHRVDAPCLDVPRCGGCVFQTFDYKAQLEHKLAKIKTLFPDDTDLIKQIISSPKVFAYRSKMDFSFSQNKALEKFLGLTQAKGNGRVIMTKTCHLATSWMNEVLKRAQAAFVSSSLLAYDRKGHGDVRSFIVRQPSFTQEKMVILEVVAHGESQIKKTQIDEFMQFVTGGDKTISCFLRIVQMIPKVPTQIYEMHLSGPLHIHEKLKIEDKELTFKISPSAFFQPNSHSAQILFNEIARIVKSLKVKKVCDLFCGTGTISLCVSAYVDSCVGIELNPYAVFDALENKELNQITNVEFIAKDASDYINETNEIFDLVIVDPPRAGLGLKACQLLQKFKARYILYVSCNPLTQAIDLKTLKESGYKACLIQPLDQFPHTNHVENIILLEKILEP
jgi:23S rRNA (uracil1939-C5)-methyltransferase